MRTLPACGRRVCSATSCGIGPSPTPLPPSPTTAPPAGPSLGEHIVYLDAYDDDFQGVMAAVAMPVYCFRIVHSGSRRLGRFEPSCLHFLILQPLADGEPDAGEERTIVEQEKLGQPVGEESPRLGRRDKFKRVGLLEVHASNHGGFLERLLGEGVHQVVEIL